MMSSPPLAYRIGDLLPETSADLVSGHTLFAPTESLPPSHVMTKYANIFTGQYFASTIYPGKIGGDTNQILWHLMKIYLFGETDNDNQ